MMPQGPFHGGRMQPTDAMTMWMVEEDQQLQEQTDHDGDAAHQQGLGLGALAAVGEEQQVDEDDHRDQEHRQPQWQRDDPLGPVDPVDPRLLAIGVLVHPPVVRRLLGRRLRVGGLHGAEHLGSPRVDLRVERAVSHGIPLGPDDRARVAHQLPLELGRGVGGQELGGLDLLGDDRGLGLGTRPRLVVGAEGQEDDEAEEHREPGGQHPEHPRGPVTVAEVAALRSPPADQEHGGAGQRRSSRPPRGVPRTGSQWVSRGSGRDGRPAGRRILGPTSCCRHHPSRAKASPVRWDHRVDW